MKRKLLLLSLGAALFSAALTGCGTKATDAVRETMTPLSVRQVVAADNGSARTIMWQLPQEVPATVEIRKKGEKNISSFPAASRFLEGSKGQSGSYIYEVTLANLAPNTVYEYRTRTGDSVSAWMPLHTAREEHFSALIFPDSQSADYNVWKDTAEKGFKALPDAEFFIMMGDLVDNGDDESQWQRWFAAVPALKNIPVAPLMGNHEAYSLDWKACNPTRFLAHFSLPQNGDAALPEMFWSFDWGPVHFAVLNTDMPEIGDMYPNLETAQKEWLARDLAQTKKTWRVVLMHRDPLQYRIAARPERKEGFSGEGISFMPVIEKAGADLVLSAHLHTYRNRGHIKNFSRDDTGPLYILTGLAGDVRYPNLWTDHALDVTVAPQPETDNFLMMEADAHTLTLRTYRTDGLLLDETVLKK